MFRLACAFAALVVLIAPSASDAQGNQSQKPTASELATEQAAEKLGQDWLARVAVWSSAQQTVFVAQERALVAVSTGSLQALDFAAKGQAKEGAAWAQDWAKARRLQMADAQSALAALSPPPPPPVEIANLPGIGALDTAYRSMAAKQSALGQTATVLGEEIIGLTERTAGGDAAAASQLKIRRFDVAITMLRGENIVIQASLSSSGQNHAQDDIIRSDVAGNLAMIAFLRAQQSYASGDAASLRAATAEMRSDAAAAAAAAEQAPLDASSSLGAIRSAPAVAGTPLEKRIEAAFATYADSAEAEKGLSQIIVAVADRLEKGDAPDSQAIKTALSGLNPLVERRLELDRRRKQIIAGEP